MQKLIDDYIIPMTKMSDPDFGPLKKALLTLIGIYAVGVLCAFAYNRIMVYISQGTLRYLRVDLFTHMESLPIKFLIPMPMGTLCLSIQTMWIPPPVDQPEHSPGCKFSGDHCDHICEHDRAGYSSDATDTGNDRHYDDHHETVKRKIRQVLWRTAEKSGPGKWVILRK